MNQSLVRRSKSRHYRGIKFLTFEQKLLTKIVFEKLQPKIVVSMEQQWFRPYRFSTDAISLISQVADKAIEFNNLACMCFVDLLTIKLHEYSNRKDGTSRHVKYDTRYIQADNCKMSLVLTELLNSCI